MPARHPVHLRRAAHYRLAEQGRIKFGIKTGNGPKDRPKAIPWFRFTSKDRGAIEQLAVAYGGDTKPWVNGWGKDAFQVTTAVSRIHVALPPEPFGDGPWYEWWDGGYCQRRCDGETCTVTSPGGGPDGPDRIQVDCLCDPPARMFCTPKVRLNVVLPELTPFVGFWRLETSSENALHEMPAAAAMILEAQGRGISWGWLELTERTQRRWDDRQHKWHTAHFTVPVLSPASSFTALLAGGSRAQSLGPAGAGRPALMPGAPVAPVPADEVDDHLADDGLPAEPEFDVDDDGITDAEVVEDEMSGWDADGQAPPAPAARRQSEADALREQSERARLSRRIHARAVTKDRPVYEAIVNRMSDGRTSTSKELTLTELERLDTQTEMWAKGEVVVALVDGALDIQPGPNAR